MSRSEEAAKKLAEALDIPEDQVLPCVVAFACLRYHGKSFVRKLAAGDGKVGEEPLHSSDIAIAKPAAVMQLLD